MDNKAEVLSLLQQAVKLLQGESLDDNCIHLWVAVETLGKAQNGSGLIINFPEQEPLEFSIGAMVEDPIEAGIVVLNLGLNMILSRFRDPKHKVIIHTDNESLFDTLCNQKVLVGQEVLEKVQYVMAHINFLKSGAGCEVQWQATNSADQMRHCCELAVNASSQRN